MKDRLLEYKNCKQKQISLAKYTFGNNHSTALFNCYEEYFRYICEASNENKLLHVSKVHPHAETFSIRLTFAIKL